MGGREFSLEVAGTLTKQLERQEAPWTRTRAPGERYLPFSPGTGRSYQGINAVWLMAAGQERGYTDPRWLTPARAGQMGAHVRPGELGAPVEFWRWEAERPMLDGSGAPVLDEAGRPRRERVRLEAPQLFRAVVFNAAQLDGLAPLVPSVPPSERQRHERIVALFGASGARLRHEVWEKSRYDAKADLIVLQEPMPFDPLLSYHVEAVHELAHWTGHPSRLGRSPGHPPGSAGCAREELRTCIASLLLGQELGIGHDPGEQHNAYIGAWVQMLSKDPHELFRAAADAGKIVRFVRGLEQGQERSAELERPEEREGEEPWLRSSPPIVVGPSRKAPAAGGRSGVNVPFAPPDPRVEFAAALREAGLVLEGLPEMDGMLRRVKVEGDGRGELGGSYIGYSDGHPGGRAENRRTGVRLDWKSSVPSQALAPADRARLGEEAAGRREERAGAQERLFEKAAAEAAVRWAVSQPVLGQDHLFLDSSGVSSHGLRQDERGNLLVPLRDTSGKLWSLQSIAADGSASVERHSRLAGSFCAMGPVGKRVLLLAEGYAAAATLLEATGHATAAVVGSANLEPAARALREKYPDRRILVAAGQRHGEEVLSIDHRNAERAASVAGGEVLLPRFAGPEGTSWQDLARTRGLEEVSAQVHGALDRAERRELVARWQQVRTAERDSQTGSRELAGLGR